MPGWSRGRGRLLPTPAHPVAKPLFTAMDCNHEWQGTTMGPGDHKGSKGSQWDPQGLGTGIWSGTRIRPGTTMGAKGPQGGLMIAGGPGDDNGAWGPQWGPLDHNEANGTTWRPDDHKKDLGPNGA